jgi:chromosome segregation ATPase
MSKTIVYDVLRGHEGDRFYKEGAERELTEADAAHLVKLGVLKATGRKPKAAAETPDTNVSERNKADTAVAAIKAEVDTARAAADSALKAIDNEIVAKQSEIDDIDALIAAKKVELSDLDAAIAAKTHDTAALAAGEAALSEQDKDKTEPANATKPEAAAKAKA